MPELPDVEIFKQYLNATSLHQRIKTVMVRTAGILEDCTATKLRKKLYGSVFEFTQRHGKYLFVQVKNDDWLMLHFGMTGHLKYFKNPDKEPPHSRLLISFTNGYHLSYVSQRKLGKAVLLNDPVCFIKKNHLGPDALEIDLSDFKNIFKNRTGAIKSALMNQSLIAGIGNVYSDEILFQTCIHPKTKVDRLDEGKLEYLFLKMKKVLHIAIDSCANSDLFPDFCLLPHRYNAGTCPHCNCGLKKIKISGRTAYYCPRCQSRRLG